MVVNLAAGLDARPYRMALPSSLKWVEVDLPGILDYKEEILRGEKPVCALERVRLDLSDVSSRRDLFRRLGEGAKRVLVITEGLLIYLTAEEVGALAEDLAAPESFQRWVLGHRFAGSPAPAPAGSRRHARTGSRAAEVRPAGRPGILRAPPLASARGEVAVQGSGPREAASARSFACSRSCPSPPARRGTVRGPASVSSRKPARIEDRRLTIDD